MPPAKILKATNLVRAALEVRAISRTQYRSLLGCLRHVATCVRPARPFLQRLRMAESHLHRWSSVQITEPMRQELAWWILILHSPQLNGVPLEYFHAHPPADITIGMDASDTGLCALDEQQKRVLTYQFSPTERSLIADFNAGHRNGFDINYRELLSCAFAVHTWSRTWRSDFSSCPRTTPIHVHFRIDNTSAVAWQSKMASMNTRAQTIIRLLGYWEVVYGLRFSSSHVAGVDNVIADAGSRLTGSSQARTTFANLTHSWSQAQPQLDTIRIEQIWQDICASTPWQTQHTPSTNGHSPSGNPSSPA